MWENFAQPRRGHACYTFRSREEATLKQPRFLRELADNCRQPVVWTMAFFTAAIEGGNFNNASLLDYLLPNVFPGLSPWSLASLNFEARTGLLAELTFVSADTVRTHIKHVYTKCDVHSRQELISLIEAQG